MPPTCTAILLLVSIFLLSHPSSATIGDPTELLSKATSVQISPVDTWSCVPPSSPGSSSCAFDGDTSTKWTMNPGQLTATITVDLNSGAIIDHFEVSFVTSSVIPSSVVITLFGNDVTWTTYNNKSCQPSDRHLRESGSLYYSCTPVGSFWNASVPLGLFSVRNGSNGWLWWRTFSRFQLTILANDADFINQTENSSIAIADIGLYGWDQPMNVCNCHPLGVQNVDVPCNSNRTCQCKTGIDPDHCFPDLFDPRARKTARGMISGFSQIPISVMGYNFQNLSRIIVGNDYQCNITKINDTVIIIQPSAGQPSDLRSVLPIWICWERPKGAVSCLATNLDFTYLPDPVVYSISPRTSITYGGITQTVIGENLDLVSLPYITVYTVQQTDPPVLTTSNYLSKTQFFLYPEDKFCKTVNSTMLTCLSMQLNDPFVDTRQYLSYIGISLGINLYNNFSTCPVPLPCDFTITNTPNTDPYDGSTPYPVYKGMTPLNIRGSGFSTLFPLHEYRVEVGGIACEIINVIQNVITYNPPQISNLNDYTQPQDIVLFVGARYSLTAGKLQYYKNWIDDPKNRNPLIGGLVGGILGLILLIAIIIFIVYYRRRRREKETLRDDEVRYTRTPGENAGPITEYLRPEVKAQVDRYTVPYNRIELVNELGKGNFGQVFKGTLTDKGGAKQPVAIKSLHGIHEIKDRVEFVEEAILMADFCHKNVLSLIAIVIEQDVPFVVLPLMEHGDLRNYVSNQRNLFNVGQLVNFSLEVAEGMEYLASRKFVHRDLAARNCMINKDLLVKVADFGLARDIFEKDYYRAKDNQRPMPVKWMAIECLSSNTAFTEKSDVWAYGVLVWEVMTRGKRPYNDVDNLDMKRYLMEGRRLEKPPAAPEFMYAIMWRCWLPNRDDRPRFKDIVKELKEILSAAEANRDAAPSSPDGDRGMSIRVDGDRAPSYLQLSGNQQQ